MHRSSRPLAGVLVAFAVLAAACTDSSTFDAYRPDATTTVGSAVSAPPESAGPSPLTAATKPLPIDPDVRIGKLDNGLTYYLRSNQTPGGSVSLRLAVDAGSAQQETPDNGTAHFLEHMMFNGTEKFPGNNLTTALATLGIQFGADTNAYTNYDETVYMLSADTGNAKAVSTAFDVLAEWASAATLDPTDVADEIGVVRDEMRQDRESADGMILTEFEDMYTAGSSYQGYATIGSAGAIESMTAPPLRAFYDRWYRPDNMAVIVVGDMSLDNMEKAITRRFASMKPRGTDLPAHNDFRIVINADASGRVVTNPGNIADNISVDLQLRPLDLGSLGGERGSIIEGLMISILDTRLSDGFQRGTLRTSTSPTMDPFAVSRGLRYVGTNLEAGDLKPALTDLFSLWKGAAENGFTATEFSRAGDGIRSQLDNALQQDGSRQDFGYAASYVSHFLEGADIDTTQSRVERMQAILDSLSPADVTDYWREVLRTSGPIIAAVGADPATLPSATMMVQIAVDTAAAETSGMTTEPPIEALMTRPDAAPLTGSTTTKTANGPVIEWDLPNGARVVFQRSRIQKATVSIATASEGGWSQMPTGSRAIAGLVTTAVSRSGLAGFGRSRLDNYLSAVSVSLNPYIDPTTEGFFGSSSTDDLEILFQLLNLSITSARVDGPALREARTFAADFVTASSIDPKLEADIAMSNARSSDSPDWVSVPTDTQLADLTPGNTLALYNSRLGKIDRTVIAVVGDADPSVVEDLARRYIGSLDAGVHDTWIDLLPPMPDGIGTTDIVLAPGVNTGGVDMLFSTPVDVTARVGIVAHVLETILSARIIDTIREQLGASYGGTAEVSVFYAPDERVDGSITIDGDPTRVDEIRSVVLAQIADLAANGPNPDEFDRAISVINSDYHFVDNQLFINTILTSRLFPDETILDADNRLGLLEGVKPVDVRDLARIALPSDRRIEVITTVP